MAASDSWFTGKSVIVTGAGSGIGRSAARRFAEEGARVCVVDLQAACAQSVATAIVASGGQAFACTADVAQESDNERMVAETVYRYGDLNVAFLNAGYGGWAMDVLEGDITEFDRIIATNLRGCWLGVRSVMRAMAPGGAIVVTASAGGLTGVRSNPVYAASKHGVVGLVRSLAPTLAERGVRINALCPGGVRTPMVGFPVQDLDMAPYDLPMVAYGTRAHPEHIAEVALFLASPRSAGVNGSAMLADGAQTSVLVAPPRPTGSQ